MSEDLIISEILSEIDKNGEILQKDIAKNLEISNARCSKLLIKLEKEGLITRERVRMNKSRGYGYLVKLVKKSVFRPLLSENGRFAVCIGCIVDCNPPNCASLNKWIKNLPDS